MAPPLIGEQSAAAVIARFLKARGVKRVYALCGGHIMPIWMRLDAEGIRLVDVRDERAADYMAHAESELTGTLGVALVPAGPGVTNAMTGLANLKASASAQSMSTGAPSPLPRTVATGGSAPATVESVSGSNSGDLCNVSSHSDASRARSISASSAKDEAAASAHVAATEDLEKLTEMLQQTKDSAWLQMKEHFDRADELRGLYPDPATAEETAELSPGDEDYVVCDRDRYLSNSTEGTLRDSIQELVDETALKTEAEEAENLEEDVDPEVEAEMLSRARENSVLSIDR